MSTEALEVKKMSSVLSQYFSEARKLHAQEKRTQKK